MTNWCSSCEWSGNDPDVFYCRICGAQLIQQEENGCPNCGNAYLFPSNTKYCDCCGIALFNKVFICVECKYEGNPEVGNFINKSQGVTDTIRCPKCKRLSNGLTSQINS